MASPPPTTFIQADANTFRDLVQKLTGDTPCGGLPAPPFKLREPRQQHAMMRKLEVELGRCCCPPGQVCRLDSPSPSPVTPLLPRYESSSGAVSPSSPAASVPEEEKAIAEKGFYLHPPPPLNSPRGRSQPPELLTLFPLSSAFQGKPKQEYVPKGKFNLQLRISGIKIISWFKLA